MAELTHDDYDMEAFLRANPGFKAEPGQHYPDTYKRPNHPTFSDESIYHNEKNQGGHWSVGPDGRDVFTPGPANLQHHTIEELQDYFQRVEPGNTLNVPDWQSMLEE